MNELIELVELIKKSKFKSVSLTGLLLETGSQLERLYMGIAQGVIQTEAALLDAFPEFEGNAKRAAVLKYKLKDRLLDAVLLLNLGETDAMDRRDAYQDCHRKYAAAMVLLNKRAYVSGIGVLETLLRKAQQYEFTELSIDILRALSRYYAFSEGDSRQYEEVERKLAEQMELIAVERQIEAFYKELVNEFVRRKADKQKIQVKVVAYMEMVRPWLTQYDSYWVQLLGRLIEITLHDCLGEHTAVVRLAEAAIEYFEGKKYKSTGALQAFYNHLLAALHSTKQYQRCQELINRHADLFEPGSFNWFKFQEIRFVQAIHAKLYEQAYEICTAVVEHPTYAGQTGPGAEIWKIFEANLYLLVRGGVAFKSASAVHFKPARFTNDIRIYHKDKSGLNVNLLLIQFFHDFFQHQTDKCLSRIEALAKYRQRYLTDPDSVRPNIFIRMLEQIPKAGFDWEILCLRTAPLLNTLIDNSPAQLSQNYELEIIPYEVLWEFVLAHLKKSRRNDVAPFLERVV